MRDLLNDYDDLLNEIMFYKETKDLKYLKSSIEKAQSIIAIRNELIRNKKKQFEQVLESLTDEGFLQEWFYNGRYHVAFRPLIDTSPCIKESEK